MAAVRNFRELEAYKMALRQAEQTFVHTQAFPQEEMDALSTPLRYASRAVAVRLAEGWSKRHYPATFISKMHEALGEVMATQAWLDHACICGYLNVDQHRELDDAWKHLREHLHYLMEHAEDFCPAATH